MRILLVAVPLIVLLGAAPRAARAQGASGNPPHVPTLLADSSPRAPAQGLADCLVTTLRDGDTIVCREQGSVRLIGIDTPERDQQPFATAATAGMAALIPAGATVQILVGRRSRDGRGRLLAYVWYEGTSVNWLMVRQGWAVAVRYPPDTALAPRFEAAESRAAAEERGLWRVGGFSCRPIQHRAQEC